MVLKFSVEAKSIVALPLSPQRTRTLNYQFSERDYAIIAKNLFMCRFGSKKVPASAVELWAGQDESEQKQFEILRAHLPAEDFEVFARLHLQNNFDEKSRLCALLEASIDGVQDETEQKEHA
jgi:hypothetical protein